KPRMIEGFGPETVSYDRVAFGDIDAVRTAIMPETAGIIIEPIQGEGGIRAASTEFLVGLRELCDQHDMVLCFDEIQSGAGRTGKFFSYQHHDVTPDIVTAAKGIGGGFPVSAVLANQRVAQYMTPGTHGSTYAGQPLGVRIAQTAIDLIREPGFMEVAEEKGKHLQRRLKDLSHNFNDVVTSVDGKGLMIGMKLAVPNAEFLKRLREKHLIAISTADGGIRLLPPLIVTVAEIEHAVDVIRDVAHSFRPA
ncbi:MAG TPA: aminotransferase class III-fold pyridoxal phosphate-dependent enzyme, partial [Alphaproteobacteria bacterium]